MEFSDQGVRSVEGDDGAKEVSWADLTEIRIVTNGNGPFAEDISSSSLPARSTG